MSIVNNDAKSIEINPNDGKIRIKISPERVELRKQIYECAVQIALAFYHFNDQTPRDIAKIGEYTVEKVNEIYEQIEKMDKAEGKTI